MLDKLEILRDRLNAGGTMKRVDVLSEAIFAMRTGRASSNRLRADSPWCYRFDAYEGAGFHVLLRGEGWLIPERGAPCQLRAGSVVLVPRGSAHVLSDTARIRSAIPIDEAVDDPDGPTDFLCGKYRLDRARTHPVLAELPDTVVLHTEAGSHPELRSAVELLAAELSIERPGRETVTADLLDLLLSYLIRAWLDDNAETGWSRALHDREIAAALDALHADPAAPWRIEELAAKVGLSRATLARRFSAFTGQSPMAYLAWWRLTTAAHLLRATDHPLPVIARKVGYGSPFAFSHAFKRQWGSSPGSYRSTSRTPVST